MSRRLLRPISFNGIGLQALGRRSHFSYADGAFASPAYSSVDLARIGRFPSHVRMQPGGKMFPLEITALSSDSEGIFQAVTEMFDPNNGEQYLVVEDCDGVEKRVLCVPQQVILSQAHDKPLVVPLWAAKPYLEDINSKTISGSILAPAISLAITATQQGSAPALPLWTITPVTAKYATMGYQRMFEVAYANRSEFPLTGPASNSWLIQLTGTTAWDTSAIIDVAAITTAVATTITLAQAMPFEITVTSTAGFDQEGMLITTGTEEQFIYQIKNGVTFTLLARAGGGTAAALHTGGTYSVHQSRMQVDGRDIAVFVDSVQVAPEKVRLSGLRTATTKVWIEIVDAPASTARCITNLLSHGWPVQAYLTFLTPHGFQPGDHLAFLNNAGNWETALVRGVPNAYKILITGGSTVRNSVTAGSVTAPFTIYKQNHHIQVAWNYAPVPQAGGAIPLPARPTDPYPPLIELATSTNLLWNWLGQMWANDGELNPGGWRRIIYPGRADVAGLLKNRMAAKTALDFSAGAVRFADIEPTAARPNFDALEFQAACGIDDVLGAIEYDASVGWPFALQVIGRDLLGLDALIFARLGHEVANHEPPSIYTNGQETPPQILQAVVLRARNSIVTGLPHIGALTALILVEAGVDGQLAQAFSLTEDTTIHGMVISAAEDSAGSASVAWLISTQGNSGAPSKQVTQMAFRDIAGAAAREVCGGMSIILPAGRYMLEIFKTAGGTGTVVSYYYSLPQYPLGNFWWIQGGVWIESEIDDMPFAILSYETDNQEEMLGASRTSKELTLDNVTIVHDPARTPLVVKRADEAAYYYDLVLTMAHGVGGAAVPSSVRLRYLIRNLFIGVPVYINFGDARATAPDGKILEPRSAIGTELTAVLDGITIAPSILAALTTPNDPWGYFPPGAVLVSVVEFLGGVGSDGPFSGAVNELHQFSYRDTWQA